MRIKAIIGFIILTVLFFSGGIYITSANNRAIENLQNVVRLNEVAHRRAELLNKIKLTQADLLLADSPHATNIDIVIARGKAIEASLNNCFSCHHSDAMERHFNQVQNEMNDYLRKLGRVYGGAMAGQPRSAMELASAYESGERLYAEISSLSITKAHKIPDNIALAEKEITRTKHLIMTLVIAGPIIALVLIFFFIKRFTTSISVLTNATGRIRGGDLTHTITEPLHDEFQDLATAFNQMALSLKKESEQVVVAESRYRTLFESAVDAIFILEAEGERAGSIIAANQAAADMHGYAVSELTSLTIQDLCNPETAAMAPKRFKRLLNGEKIEARAKHRKKDGSIFPVEFSAGLLEIGPKKYILAFGRDISLRVRTEEALERSRQLATAGQMAAGLANEIKNPLTGIKVSMEVLLNELELLPEDREIFLRIIREVQRIETLLKNLLNYARPSRPAFSLIDLNAQLENCLRNAEMILKSPEYAEKKQIVIQRNMAEDLPMINADPDQVQQIFLNLFLNAIEAIPGAGTVSLTTRPGPEKTVLVELADTGKGMAPQVSAEIFKPFYTTKPKGNGLGLAITKRLVELHHGAIEVASAPGQGATFLITFPVEQGQKQQPEAA